MDYAALGEQLAAAVPMPFTEVPTPQDGLTANVDGDYLAYFCAGNDDTNPGDARRNVLSRLDKIKFLTGATRVVIHLSTEDCTKGDRYHVARQQPYQGQRTSGRRPVNWQHLREWMTGYDGPHFEPKLWKTREADDGMAYVAHTYASLKGQLHVVHTADKDMRMFAGKHVIWKTMEVVDVPLDTYEIIGPDDEVYGHKWFWLQMLQGDTADHIPGLRGIGKVAATKLLAGTTCNAEAVPRVIGEYQRLHAETWADCFVEQASLLWMRVDRHADIADFLRLGVFGEQVLQAVDRMRVRVSESKQYIKSLAQ